MVILFILETAALLATRSRPSHIGILCSRGLNHLPPRCSSNYFEVYDKKRQLFTVAFLSVLTSYKSDQKRRRHQSVVVGLFASRQSRQ